MSPVSSQYSEIARDTFLPQPGRIVELIDMTAKDRYFRIELEKPLGHRPGQFVMVSVLGVGEAPISISNGPCEGQRAGDGDPQDRPPDPGDPPVEGGGRTGNSRPLRFRFRS